MTVNPGVSRVDYFGNGVTTSYAVPFQFFELAVLLNNFVVDDDGVAYTVTGGNGNTGTVTFATAPGNGVPVSIQGATVIKQDVDLAENDPFPPDTVERALDRLTMISKDLSTLFATTVNAEQSAVAASSSALAAHASEVNAEASESAAHTSEVNAGNSASAAALSASSASGSATSAGTSASAAAASATAANTSKTNAATSEGNAAASASAAAASATAANTSKTNAATSETNAGNSATAAAASAAAANTSKTNAATSETNAAASASAAAASATAANTSKTNAATSETNAGNSATAAAASAAAANTSKVNAAASETNAGNSATAAAGSASSAAASAAAAAATYDLFDDRMLGSKASDPSTDNDGNPLVAGTFYWNTVSNVFRVWGGSAWSNAFVGSLNPIDLLEIPSASTPPANTLRLYSKDNGGSPGLFLKDPSGTEQLFGQPIAMGTFSPTLTFATPGNLAVSYVTRLGNYIRIGNMVIVSVQIRATPTFSTASGTLRIDSLPFTVGGPDASSAGAVSQGCSALLTPVAGISTSGFNIMANPTGGTTYFAMQYINGTAVANLANTNLTSGTEVRIGFTAVFMVN